MKVFSNILLIFSLFTIIVSCEKKENDALNISGKLVSHTACLSPSPESKSEADAISGKYSCIGYRFDKSNNKLLINHMNAGFNCCPDSIYCKVAVNNDTILIQEFEKSSLCKCNCLYNLNIEINGVIPDKYVIKVIEPYIKDQQLLVFNIDLRDKESGSFCAVRDRYPWGA